MVFFSAAERVHVAKATAQAERVALRSAASRAQSFLTRSEASLEQAKAEANAARSQKQCGPVCRTKLAAEASAQVDVEAARWELLFSESKATTESPLQAPVWLLPAALDVVAFLAIWTGLSPTRSRPAQRVTRAQQRRPKRRARTSRVASAKALVRSAQNDNIWNVVRFGPR